MLVRTTSINPDFKALVTELDADLAVRDGDEHDFYHQFNSIDALDQVVVLYSNSAAISCGALKNFDARTAEIKRMYTKPEFRGLGFGSALLTELETWAKELGFQRCILETGKKQPEAIHLYKKNGYCLIENYGQYLGVANSICFEKKL
jgi:putative acetyltransferase